MLTVFLAFTFHAFRPGGFLPADPNAAGCLSDGVLAAAASNIQK
jgi:hypothetical protein